MDSNKHNFDTEMDTTNTHTHRYLEEKRIQVVTRIMDENSMNGRSFWGWMRQRSEEIGHPVLMHTDVNNVFTKIGCGETNGSSNKCRMGTRQGHEEAISFNETKGNNKTKGDGRKRKELKRKERKQKERKRNTAQRN